MIAWLRRLWHRYALMCARSAIYDARIKRNEADAEEWNAVNAARWHGAKLNNLQENTPRDSRQ